MTTISLSNQSNLPELVIPENHGWRIGIVQSRFNSEITDILLQEAQTQFKNYRVPFDIARVAGCYEIPYRCQAMAKSKRFHGLLALGCLVRGETIHFDLVAQSTNHGIMEMILKYHLPIGFGIITADTIAQAHARTWIGAHAADAVLDALLYNLNVLNYETPTCHSRANGNPA